MSRPLSDRDAGVLSLGEVDVLRHAVGLGGASHARLPYRNGFKTPHGHHARVACEQLVERELMECGADGDTYYVTEDGFKWLFGRRWRGMKARAER